MVVCRSEKFKGGAVGGVSVRWKFAKAEAGDGAGDVADGADEEDSLGLGGWVAAVFEVPAVTEGKRRVDAGVAGGGEAVDQEAKIADRGDGLTRASVGSGDGGVGRALQVAGGAQDEIADHLGGEGLDGVGGVVGPEVDVQKRFRR